MIKKITDNTIENIAEYMVKNWNISSTYINQVRANIENAFVYEDEIIKGIAYFIAEDDEEECAVKIYVDPKFRRQGIGTALNNKIMDSLEGIDSSVLLTQFKVNDDGIEEFYKKMGYEKWLGEVFMAYEGSYQPEIDLEVIPYEDKYFEEYAKIEQESFYDIRKESDIKPYELSISEEVRDYYNESDMYLALVDGEVVAGVLICEGFLDNIAVKQGYQGKGFGKKITQFAMNKALSNGAKKLQLTVLECNKKAIKMYEDLGFQTVSATRIYRKFIK